MAIAIGIRQSMERSSWIRKMFEEGTRLKSVHGENNVFDFSLGNPDVEPPEEFFVKLKDLASGRKPGIHGYMPNAGYEDVRKAIAAGLEKKHGTKIKSGNIIMTCGAAGGLNVVMKTILDPGDEVIVPKPYFVEYGFYAGNHNGKLVPVKTNDDFSLNIDNIKKAVTEKTKAVLINSPNNPTGRVYTSGEIEALAGLLKSYKFAGRTIYLISDEPYREIVYNKISVPWLFDFYSECFVVTSYSKSLSVPGERIGYIALNPSCDDAESIIAGMILCNRIIGFVNAPAFLQRIVSFLGDVKVDVRPYEKRRNILMEGLGSAGYEFARPDGAFYLFCRAPGGDDIRFVQHLQKYNILVVPGAGFDGPGHFRIAYCVPEDMIKRSIPKFKEGLDSYS